MLHVMDVYAPVTPTNGETTPAWRKVAECVPCNRTWKGGNETVSGGVRTVEVPTEVVHFRGIPWLDSRHRLRFQTTGNVDDVLEIRSVGDPNGDGLTMIANCNRLEST